MKSATAVAGIKKRFAANVIAAAAASDALRRRRR